MQSSAPRIAVLVAHPRRRSFTVAMATAFAGAARAAGADVVERDLYRLRFDPRLRAGEMPDHLGAAVGPDVAREREAIAGADIFAFFYPLWFNATPAMMKGYVDRVFGMDFGYTARRQGGNQPMLGGRKMITFTSSGAPQDWVERSGAWESMQQHFDAHFAAMTGLEIIGHHNVGGVVGGMRKDVVERHQREVAERARRIVAAYRPEPDQRAV
ncbi:NAD(P)H-dependent oxidoreductase [Brevundimonas sp.]|uniref:NAD(P)H-dependent oxidoreductase n=1 Tax=Brevundimonas sp. TaxID=1871086 RepID=UPI002D496986|nr:NAD(P)H-dependent oxidoreductase [Brevundimonas sp.]HYD27692.1 NAD(P)H-dependent oxidoreductase [Brevundimonas sp.]